MQRPRAPREQRSGAATRRELLCASHGDVPRAYSLHATHQPEVYRLKRLDARCPRVRGRRVTLVATAGERVRRFAMEISSAGDMKLDEGDARALEALAGGANASFRLEVEP